MTLRIDDALLDEGFDSYGLSRNLLQQKHDATLPSPVLMLDDIQISYARHQQRNKINRLYRHTDGQFYFMNAAYRLTKIVFTGSEVSFDEVAQVSPAAYKRSPEEVTVSGTDHLIFISDGKGQLAIFDSDKQHEEIYREDISGIFPENNHPAILSLVYKRADDTYVCVLQSILDAEQRDSEIDKEITFVERGTKEGDSSHKLEPQYFLAFVHFSMQPEGKLKKLYHAVSVGEDAVQCMSYHTSSDCLLMTSHTPYYPLGGPNLPIPGIEEETEGERFPPRPDLDQAMIDAINERLAPLTTETEVNPYQHLKMEAHEDYEETEGAEEPTSYVFVYRWKGSRYEPVDKRSLSTTHFVSLIPSESETSAGVMVCGFDVDLIMVDMIMSRSGDLTLSHVKTFDAMSYILSGKKQRRYVKLSKDFSFCGIVEHQKYIWLYQRKKKETDHKSVHQLIEMSDEEIVGFFMDKERYVVLTRRHVYEYNIA
ncbi:NudC domain containing 1 [Planoprotostelium fungivorum]|uniref:NudC domain containing 1 n=1 Tax=Planoprotostelium fungivorum TaxID=1890364 RepID=A0A2P6NUX3_9EUKA|nr:NudC domain containing 1 [Planoprotostelium fungivorum]